MSRTPQKKLYLVRREVLATNIKQAATNKGEVFEIVLAADALQPNFKKEIKGFEEK